MKSEKITYSWEDVSDRIFKLSSKLKTLIKPGDRCLILSENNPNWFISDISIMNAGGISVPIFTTYSDNDYKLVQADTRNIIFVGRSRSGKTTLIEVLKDRDYSPGLMKILRGTKNAKLETNVEIQVPLFVNENEIVKVDTRDMTYVGRAKS